MNNLKEFNSFDELQGLDDPDYVNQLEEEQKAFYKKLDYAIHKIFAQNEDGEFVLNHWKKTLMFTPTATENADLVEIGMSEGMKSFIREILITIERVENE